MENPLSDHDAFLAKIAHLLKLDKESQSANLLAAAKARIEESRWESWGNLYTIYMDIPSEQYAQLRPKIESIQKLILQKGQFLLRTCEGIGLEDVVINPEIPYEPDWRDQFSRTSKEELISEIETQKNLMVAVATGGPRIQAVNDEYKERQLKIHKALTEHKIEDPNPYHDLWDWYGKWSSGDLPTYQSRRQYLAELFEPFLEQLRKEPFTRVTALFPEPTGWAKIDRNLGEARKRLEEATDGIGYQQVGLICRETLITMAQLVFKEEHHPSLDGVPISKADAKRMLEAYLAVELAGGANEAARRHAKGALDLANDLTHRRTAVFRDAALCAEATTSVVNLIAIISGQRNP